MAEILPPPEPRPTLGLCVITKELSFDLRRKLQDLLQYVDEVYVQVNGGGDDTRSRSLQVSTFAWTGNFADARNALLDRVKTDYWTWMDTDDEIVHPEQLRPLVDHMAATDVCMLFAPYEYLTDARGKVTELQDRERIIKRSTPGKWDAGGVFIHETFIPERDVIRETTNLVVWRHLKTEAEHWESMKRNRQIMEARLEAAGDKLDQVDPRLWYYLGLNYGQDHHYKEAITCFRRLIATSGWDEERYRAWLQVFSCSFELGDYQQAESAALSAASELPDWPDAYFMLQQLYYQTDAHAKSLEWFKVGIAKPTPESDSAVNPLVRREQPLYLAAYSALATGDAPRARALLNQLIKIDPEYPGVEQLRPEINQALAESGAIAHAKALISFAERHTGSDPLAVLLSLPPELAADIRLTEERRRLMPGKRWPKGSVVFFCGPSYEEWGPEYLDQGMGGSEEAVIYLSRALAKAGHEVTVYNQRTKPWVDAHKDEKPDSPRPVYLPWTEINPNDTFDVFVAWRNPTGCREVTARKILCDLHDIIDVAVVYANLPYVDAYLFKSQWHRQLYPEVPDDKAVVIGNGIEKGQFK
jgi:tetratricopeptide (TPR) repeat protein